MKCPELYAVAGELAGRRFAVGEGGLRLGRSSSNDIHVPDEGLSRNHCFFEPSGEAGIRVTDLGSANGTLVNGEELGGEPRELKAGDEIEAGSLRFEVVEEGAQPKPAAPVPGTVDLGLGEPAASSPGAGNGDAPAGRRRSPVMNIIWAAAILALGAAIWLVLSAPPEEPAAGGGEIAPAEREDRLVEMSYEKVAADRESIFRYAMTFSQDGTLKTVIDDVPGENRHIVKSAKLGEQAVAQLQEILADADLAKLDDEYAGSEMEPEDLKSWTLGIVTSGSVRSIRVVNAQEPDAFRRVREKLEAFSKNELGIWAIQYSRDKLIELAKASAEVGRVKWEDREVEYGNLHAAIAAWREAMFYLETINPKPEEYAAYREAKEKAEQELENRYKDQRFKADRAINLADWETARTELQVLSALVPDREDDRNREATAKLVDVEKRLKNGGRR